MAYSDDVPSKAAIDGHPIHPMLISFPIASLSLALLSDVIFWTNQDGFWAQVSVWLLLVGVLTGLAAAVFGLIDFVSIQRIRDLSISWIHAGGNVVAMVLALINLLLRLNEPAEAVLPWGLILSVVTGLILVITGWLGGEMSYRHRIGVNSEGSEHRSSAPQAGD